jgi:hypothetical protein
MAKLWKLVSVLALPSHNVLHIPYARPLRVRVSAIGTILVLEVLALDELVQCALRSRLIHGYEGRV